MFDIVIVGSGPAGISAALNAKLHNKNILWFGSKDLSDKVNLAEQIANYPGIGMVSGAQLNEAFKQQIDAADLTITEKKVTNIMSIGNAFMVLADNEVYEAKSIILATGVLPKKGFAGEEELLGKGLSYCATCDGFLYKDKTIAVYLGDEHYKNEVSYLASLAKMVYLFGKSNAKTWDENVVTVDSNIRQIVGSKRVESIQLIDGNAIAVDGLFILRNAVFPGKILDGLEMDNSHIVVSFNMQTNIKGVFACGDCVGRPYQIAKAVGDGNVAAHSAIEYLNELERIEA